MFCFESHNELFDSTSPVDDNYLTRVMFRLLSVCLSVCPSVSVCLFRKGSLTVDRLLMIFDMRYLKKTTPLQLNIDPIFLRFIPTFSNRICVVSQVSVCIGIFYGASYLTLPWGELFTQRWGHYDEPNAHPRCARWLKQSLGSLGKLQERRPV